GPSTVQEIGLGQGYAALAEAVPELLDHLREPRTAMADAVQMEGALFQLKGACAALLEITTAGVIVLAADLTADLDRVQEASEQAWRGQDAVARLEARAVRSCQDQVREEAVQLAKERRKRAERRRERLAGQERAAPPGAAPPGAQAVEETEGR